MKTGESFMVQGFKISTNNKDFDFEVIYKFISQSYWAAGIPRKTLEKAVSNSFCFGIFDEDKNQVGFARLITDKATFAYLADVFIVKSHQGKGLGRWLIKTIISHPEIHGLRRIMLATRDAHDLYSKYGFKPIEKPEMLMQIWEPEIYKK